MSVAIFGYDDFAPEDDSKDFRYLPVSGEATFSSVWEECPNAKTLWMG